MEAIPNYVHENIIYGPKIPTPNVQGMGSTIYEHMLANKDLTAQIDALTGTKDTYGQLLQRCVRTAIKMKAKGVKPKDVVVMCGFNTINSFDPIIGSLFVDAVPASLDPTISLEDTVHLIKQVRPKMLFVGPEAVELITEALRQIELESEVVVFGEGFEREFLAPSEEEEDFSPVRVKNVRDTAMIFFSSGTTGLPKGICLSHLGILGIRDPKADSRHMPPGTVIVNYTSTYWISSTTMFLVALFGKATRLICPKFEIETGWELVSKFGVNGLFLPPTHMLALCRRKRSTVDLSKLQVLLIGGSPISKEQLLEIESTTGKPVVNGYALTEFSGAGLQFDMPSPNPEIRTKLIDSIGKPLAGFAYKVVDLETEQAVGPNTHGELRVKTEFQMNGYYNLDSSREWDADGFLKTGDIVYYDEDLNFFFVDRCKEMMKYQSWHVAPAKLEAVLMTHPAVQSAVVIAVPHSEDGDHPMGVVTLRKSFELVTPEEIAKYVEERVDERQKLRGGVRIVAHIPLTPTGKIIRRMVKSLVLN